MLQDRVVDFILCDINLPLRDGLEFVKQLPGVAKCHRGPCRILPFRLSPWQFCPNLKSLDRLLTGSSRPSGIALNEQVRTRI